MRGPFVRKRLRGASLSTVVPSPTSSEYSHELADIAARIIYKSPLPSANDLPIYILNSASFPDSKEVNYDRLLPYVLARLPGEDELIGGKGYEVVFFAGGSEERGDPDKKKGRPSITWMMQAYNVLSRAMRKRLAKLYLVHERRWVRVVTEMFSTIVSPKFRRKVLHVSTLSQLALEIPIEDLLIPPSAYYRDRKLESQIFAPYATGKRAFGVSIPLPEATDGTIRLPRVLREATAFLLADENVKTEGLFRVNARAITLEVLKEAYDRGQKFIVWREGSFVMNFHQWKEGFGDVCVHETDEVEGYPVFAAAGLIKLWYSDLKNTIFPETSYQFLEANYGPDIELSQEKILDLIGANSDWSQVSSINRQILRIHLLPMLSEISRHAENKMSPKASAVCFAPSLLCGSDPVKDARMCGIISKIIEYAIEQWTQGLSQHCGLNQEHFQNLLKLPTAPSDREDPLEKERSASAFEHDNQSQGIMLVDHFSSTSDEDEDDLVSDSESPTRPPLPPRTSNTENSAQDNAHEAMPPRYSTIMGPPQQGVQTSTVTTQPQRQPTAVLRKPTPAQSRAATSEIIPTASTSSKPEDLGLDCLSIDSGKAFVQAEVGPVGATRTETDQTVQQDTSILPRSDTSSTVSRKPVPEH